MNIVIVGAGKLGKYMAELFSKGQHNVILIDPDDEKLHKAGWHLDIATKKGSGTDWQLLDDLLELNPDLLLALTSEDEINMVCCSLAKHLHYPRTLCRVKDNRFLNKSRLDFARIFDVDYFICPELLVAHDITRYLLSSGSLSTEYFAHGAVQMRTLSIPKTWRGGDQTLKELPLPAGVMICLIQSWTDEKGHRIQTDAPRLYFPHGHDRILPGDEVTFIGESAPMAAIHQFFQIPQGELHSVVIVGGSRVGYHLAKILAEREVGVRLMDQDYNRCVFLSEQLPHSTIMHHDGTDLDFLLSEKVGRADAFISCTNSDEINLLAATLGRQAGCSNTVAMLSNPSYQPVLEELNISHIVSPFQSPGNHMLSIASSMSVTSLVRLYGDQAELVEVTVSSHSKIVGIPLSELGPLLPKDFLIAMIQNRGRVMIAHGNRIISPGDTVVVVCHPRHFPELETIF